MHKLNGPLLELDMWSDHINRIEIIRKKHQDLFAPKTEVIYWPPGWHHIVVDMLRKIEDADETVEIVKIKHHFGHLQVHYRSYDVCEKTERIISVARDAIANSCCICGAFLQDSFRCPTHG